jgi:hypothetical protein
MGSSGGARNNESSGLVFGVRCPGILDVGGRYLHLKGSEGGGVKTPCDPLCGVYGGVRAELRRYVVGISTSWGGCTGRKSSDRVARCKNNWSAGQIVREKRHSFFSGRLREVSLGIPPVLSIGPLGGFIVGVPDGLSYASR